MQGTVARLIPAALVLAGLAYFAREGELISTSLGKTALIVAALLALLYLALTVDAAWLLSAGILSTMFAGNWESLGLDLRLGPHRVFLAVGILAVLLRAPPVRDRPRLQLDHVHFLMAAAAGFALVSAYVAGTLQGERSQQILIDQFGLLPFVLFAIAPVAFHKQRQRMILLGSLVAAGAYLSVSALLEKLELYDLLWPSYIGNPYAGGHFGRARGPFVEAAAMGLALYGCAVAAAIALVVWKRPAARALAAAVLVAAPVGALLTVTRAVWLAAVVGTVVTLVSTPALRRFFVPVAAAGVVGVLVAFAAIPGLAGDAEQRQKDKTPLYDRQNTNEAGLRMLADKPFLGVGWHLPNPELEPYFRQHENRPLTGYRAGLHNIYLYYAAGLGLIGFGLWLGALLLAFGRALGPGGTPQLAAWKTGLKAIAVAWLIVGATSPAHYPFITYLVWAWAGIATGLPALAPAATAAARQAPRGATTWSLSQGKFRRWSLG
jgi:putative inorganic carbon (hco3(-)) transporter